MSKLISPAVAFHSLREQVKQLTPEIFDRDGRYLNLVEGRWQEPGQPRAVVSPVDGSELGHLPMLNTGVARRAVVFAKREASGWAATDRDERRAKVQVYLHLLRSTPT